MNIPNLLNELCAFRESNYLTSLEGNILSALRKVDQILDSLSNQEAFEILSANIDKIR